ncbi:MAG: hypothetical protein HC817_13645, partial [Saprospiraceae bacterium]|nr:hypothetical protein [Saprospiraceae bacterium]
MRFKFISECGYKSGSLAYFSFIGKTICGTPSNFEAGESLPINVQGAQLDSVKNYTVNKGLDSKIVAGGESNIEISFQNQALTFSDTNDGISVKLPAGVRYKAGTSVAIVPNDWAISEPQVLLVGDVQILTWKQPVGLPLNGEGRFIFGVLGHDSLGCSGSKDIGVATFYVKELLCQTSGTSCSTEIITTSGGEKYFSVPLSRGAISL